MSTAQFSRRALLDLFRLGGFVRLLAVRWPSQAGDGMFQIGAASMLLFALDPTEATSSTEIAAILAVTTLPFTLAGPFAGVVIDRWRRQRILIWTNIVRIGIVAVVLPFAGPAQWRQNLFLAAVVVVLSTNRFFLATLGAVLPRLVPGEELTPANAVATIGGSIAALIGAAAGGWFAGLIGEDSGGPEATVLVAVGLFVASIIAAATFGARSLGPELEDDLPPLRADIARAVRELVDGVQRISGNRRAWAPIAVLAVLRFLTAIAAIAALLVFRNRFGAGPAQLGYLLAVFGVGAFIGAVIVAVADRRYGWAPEASMRRALVVGGIATVALSPGLREPLLYAENLLLGVAFAMAKIPGDTLVQSALPDRFRGRVFAAYDVLYNLGFLAGGIVAALVVRDAEGAEPALVGTGVAALLFWIVARRWLTGMPPAVDVETWEEVLQAEDPAAEAGSGA